MRTSLKTSRLPLIDWHTGLRAASRSWPNIRTQAGAWKKFACEDVRELIEPPYRIVYAILPDRIDMLTVRDTRRLLPRKLRAL